MSSATATVHRRKEAFESSDAADSADTVTATTANIRRLLDADTLSDYEYLFSTIDTDGSGSIDKKELRTCFKDLDLSVSAEQLQRMMLAVDVDNSGEIEFDGWYTHGAPCEQPCPAFTDVGSYCVLQSLLPCCSSCTIPTSTESALWTLDLCTPLVMKRV